MLRNFLVLLAYSAALNAQALDGKPDIYGRIDLALQYVSQDSDYPMRSDNYRAGTELKSNYSRLGVRGSEAIDEKNTLIYQLEFAITPDERGGEGHFKHRNSYIGVNTDYGQLIWGRYDTPLVLASNNVDLFYNLDGDLETLTYYAERRASNIVMYTSPNLKGTQAIVGYVSNEEEAGTTERLKDGYSATLMHTFGFGLYVAAAYEKHIAAQDIEVMRVIGQYNIGNWQLGVIAERHDDGVEKDGFLSSLGYNITPTTMLKAQYIRSDLIQDDGESISLGAHHYIKKSTRLYAYSTRIAYDDRASYFNGVGVEYRF